MQFIQIVIILKYAIVSYCANILIADVMPSPSHQIFNLAIAEALLDRGHNITVLGPSSSKTIAHQNFHLLRLEDFFSIVMNNFDPGALLNSNKLQMILFYHDYSFFACKEAFKSKAFKTLMEYPKDYKFDIILFDLTVGDCFLPLIQRFYYPPAVGITAFLIPAYLSWDFGNELYLSYIPSFYNSYSTDMTFFQRLNNYVLTYIHIILKEIYLNRHLRVIISETFGDPVDSLSNLEQHVSLLLANWDPVLNHPQGLTPNIIPIGGSHIKRKKLPKDLQDLMDNSPNGVILFSLGTNVRSDQFTEAQRKIILNTFGKFKETVLWKFESNITGLPKNVLVRKWLPQTDLLAHTNLKLFISHSGGLSTIEASYFGVPVLGMPFFIDQHMNIDNLVEKGVARKLDYAELSEDTFFYNIHELLNNKKYAENMKELSRKLKDQPQPPMDRAVFWIEYALRYNGTQFLNPKSRHLPWIITSSLDIHLFIVCAICFLMYILKAVYKLGKKIVEKSKAESKSKSKSKHD